MTDKPEIKVNPKLILRAVREDTSRRLNDNSDIRIGTSPYPSVLDDMGYERPLKIPFISNATWEGKDKEAYFIEVDDIPYYMHTVYTIAYTWNKRNPYIQVVFTAGKYCTRLVKLEANTYRVLNNSLADCIRLELHDPVREKKNKKKSAFKFRK